MGKKSKENKNTKAVNTPTITYEEYSNALLLAQKIRLENQEILEQAKTAKEKSQLVNILFEKYNILGHEASDPKEKEIAIILKVNIFIPDTNTFIDDYKNKYNKNVRLIADNYQIPAPFVISKVAEVGKYEAYLERLSQERNSKNADSKKPLEEKRKETEIPHIDVSSSTHSNYSNILNAEVLHHLDSMQKYSTRLLDSNEQLARENEALKRYNREIEGLMKRLQQENEQLKMQVNHLTSENHSMREQISSPVPSNPFSAENRLRQQIKMLEISNQELLGQIGTLQQQNTAYKDRASYAEAQLEQWQSGIQGIYDQVENFDLTFEGNPNNPKIH